jgi:hypothetical protein
MAGGLDDWPEPLPEETLDLGLVRAVIEDGLLMVFGPDGDPIPPESFRAAAAERPQAGIPLRDGSRVAAERIAAVLEAQTGGRLGSGESGAQAWTLAMLGIGAQPEMAEARDLQAEDCAVEVMAFGKELLVTSPAGATFLLTEARSRFPDTVGLRLAHEGPIAVSDLVGRLLADSGGRRADDRSATGGEFAAPGCPAWLDGDDLVIDLPGAGPLHLARQVDDVASTALASVFTSSGATASLDDLVRALHQRAAPGPESAEALSEPAATESEAGLAPSEPAATGPDAGLAPFQPAITEPDPAMAWFEPAATEPEAAMAPSEPAATGPEAALAPFQPAITEPEPAVAPFEPAGTEPEAAMAPFEPTVTGPEASLAPFQPAVTEPDSAMAPFQPTATAPEAAMAPFEPAATEPEAAIAPSEPAATGPEAALAPFQPAITEPEPILAPFEPAVSEPEATAVPSEPAATGPAAAMGPHHAAQRHSVPLRIDLPGTLAAAPEDVALVVIRGLPEAASLSAGVASGDGSWLLSPRDLAGLSLALAPAAAVDVPLDVVAIRVASQDGELTSASHTVTVPPPDATHGTLSPIPLALDPEELLAGGPFDAVLVLDVPAGAALSAGTYDPEIDAWVLLPRQLAEASIIPGTTHAREVTLSLLGVCLRPGAAAGPRVLAKVPLTIR